MQRDPMARMDLTSNPDEAQPSPDAKIARLSQRRPAPELHVDFTDDEDPSEAAVVSVDRTIYREASTLAFAVRVWKAVHISFDYTVHGPLSSAAPLCVIVLLAAITAAMVTPRLILPPTAADALRVAVATGAGGAVLVAGVGVLLFWLHKKT